MIQATHNRYVIKLHEADNTTESGIIIKGSTDTQLAVIVHIGPQVEKPLPLDTKIIVDWNQIMPVKYKNQQFFILEEKHVLGTVQ